MIDVETKAGKGVLGVKRCLKGYGLKIDLQIVLGNFLLYTSIWI